MLGIKPVIKEMCNFVVVDTVHAQEVELVSVAHVRVE
jgi:hypothetical protein